MSWDKIVQVGTLLGILVGGLWAVWSYRQNNEREFRRPLWDRQLALYFEASEAAAKVASLPDGRQRTEALNKFWSLYLGPLVIVEDDKNVADAMVNFGNCFVHPGENAPRNPCSAGEISNRSLHLAERCRISIATSWDTKFQNLISKQPKY